MRNIKKTIIFSIILISNIAFSQQTENLKLNKKNIFRIFNKTIEQDDKNKVQIVSNPWFTNENFYLKSDTIKLTNSRSYNRDYCKVINWTFYKKNLFIRSFGNYCNEPPTEKVTNESDYFELKINEVNNKLILALINQKKVIEKFEIISLEKTQSLSYKNEIKYTLTLKREK